MTDRRRTPDERAKTRGRNEAHREATRQHNERPAVTIVQLWRRAGGGTSRYNPATFSGLVQSEHWSAVDTCGRTACEGTPPHLCWWSAIGASVIELRRRRSAAKPIAEATLF